MSDISWWNRHATFTTPFVTVTEKKTQNDGILRVHLKQSLYRQEKGLTWMQRRWIKTLWVNNLNHYFRQDTELKHTEPNRRATSRCLTSPLCGDGCEGKNPQKAKFSSFQPLWKLNAALLKRIRKCSFLNLFRSETETSLKRPTALVWMEVKISQNLLSTHILWSCIHLLLLAARLTSQMESRRQFRCCCVQHDGSSCSNVETAGSSHFCKRMRLARHDHTSSRDCKPCGLKARSM